MKLKDYLFIAGTAFAVMFVLLIAGSQWTSRVEARISQHTEQLNEKLVEVDGRRNSQYGTLKRGLHSLDKCGLVGE